MSSKSEKTLKVVDACISKLNCAEQARALITTGDLGAEINRSHVACTRRTRRANPIRKGETDCTLTQCFDEVPYNK